MVSSNFVRQKLKRDKKPPVAGLIENDDDETGPAISKGGSGPLPQGFDDTPEDEASPLTEEGAAAATRQTNLHKLAFELWGKQALDDFPFRYLSAFADPDSAEKTKNGGIKIDVGGGGGITWEFVQEEGQAPYEAIRGNKRNFTQQDAEAIVALAAIRGWGTIDVHGKQEHKEKLWLAAQHLNMYAKLEFEAGKAQGSIPADAVFSPPLTVNGFNPSPDSDTYKQFLKDQAAIENAIASMKPAQPEPIDTETPAAAKTVPPAEPQAESEADVKLKKPAAETEADVKLKTTADNKASDKKAGAGRTTRQPANRTSASKTKASTGKGKLPRKEVLTEEFNQKSGKSRGAAPQKTNKARVRTSNPSSKSRGRPQNH